MSLQECCLCNGVITSTIQRRGMQDHFTKEHPEHPFRYDRNVNGKTPYFCGIGNCEASFPGFRSLVKHQSNEHPNGAEMEEIGRHLAIGLMMQW